jgi:hypothetical protein
MRNWSVHGPRITIFKFDIYLLIMTENFFLSYWDSWDIGEWEKLAHPKFLFFETPYCIKAPADFFLYFQMLPLRRKILTFLGVNTKQDWLAVLMACIWSMFSSFLSVSRCVGWISSAIHACFPFGWKIFVDFIKGKITIFCTVYIQCNFL